MHQPDGTRSRILTAARQVFAARGYQSATVRAIAADAKIDPSMVMHYFGTKANLFVAAVDVDLCIPDLTTVALEQRGETLVCHFLARWDGETDADVSMMLLRSIADDETAVEQTRIMFCQQLIPAVEPIIAEPTEAPTRAAMVISQVLGLALCRHLLRLHPLDTAPHQQLVKHLGMTIQRYLYDAL